MASGSHAHARVTRPGTEGQGRRRPGQLREGPPDSAIVAPPWWQQTTPAGQPGVRHYYSVRFSAELEIRFQDSDGASNGRREAASAASEVQVNLTRPTVQVRGNAKEQGQ